MAYPTISPVSPNSFSPFPDPRRLTLDVPAVRCILPYMDSPAVCARVYISGPMSCLPDLNIAVFRRAQAQLVDLGFSVIVPHDLTPARRPDESDSAFYDRCLSIDLAALGTCGLIALLPGWQLSKGARRELAQALDDGLDILLLDSAGRFAPTTGNSSSRTLR
jgi:hypothetical protein